MSEKNNKKVSITNFNVNVSYGEKKEGDLLKELKKNIADKSNAN